MTETGCFYRKCNLQHLGAVKGLAQRLKKINKSERKN